VNLNNDPPPEADTLTTRHLQFAWWSLVCFVVVGITLEALHAFKIGWYLEPPSQTRRLMWTLAHAHGTLLSLVHAAFAFTCFAMPARTRRRRAASPLLMAASVLLPGGFFLGGAFIWDGDPGLGIWLVPPGALCLLVAVLLTALDTVLAQRPPSDPPSRENHGP